MHAHLPAFLSCGTTFTFLCAQVMWHRVERAIAQLNRDRQWSLKAGVHGAFLLVGKSF